MHADIRGYQMAPGCKCGCKYTAFHSLSVEQTCVSEETGKDAVKTAANVAEEERSTWRSPAIPQEWGLGAKLSRGSEGPDLFLCPASFPLHSTWSRDNAGHLGQLPLSRDAPHHIPEMLGLEGAREYLPNVFAITGLAQPFTSHSLAEAPSLHPESGIQPRKKATWQVLFFPLQVAVKYCPKLVQNCLNHHQRIHFSLAWW